MNKKDQERRESLMPNGVPKNIHCYDNGGKTFDRYFVLFTKKRNGDIKDGAGFMSLSMSENPTHPMGFGMHDEHFHAPDSPAYSHLGKKIRFEDLPDECQKLVIQDYKELWDID